MGQYFHGVILNKDFRTTYRNKKAELVLYPHDYGMGAKLMETAWLGNPYIAIFEELLAGKFYGYPFVWCGDYADDIRCYLENITPEEFEEKYGDTIYIPYSFSSKLRNVELASETGKYRYLLNITKKQFVDLEKKNEPDEWVVHPLPLLCCNSNQRGGGDYWGKDEEKVGLWAYDNIGVGNEIPEDFVELEINFEE